MKRSFIPPSHRPLVRGSVMTKEHEKLDEIVHEPQRRREFLMAVFERQKKLPGLDEEWAKALLQEMFPNLKQRSAVASSAEA